MLHEKKIDHTHTHTNHTYGLIEQMENKRQKILKLIDILKSQGRVRESVREVAIQKRGSDFLCVNVKMVEFTKTQCKRLNDEH